MVSVQSTVDTGHEDMVHDAQMDYYGTKLATCSSDRSIKIFDVKVKTDFFELMYPRKNLISIFSCIPFLQTVSYYVPFGQAGHIIQTFYTKFDNLG